MINHWKSLCHFIIHFMKFTYKRNLIRDLNKRCNHVKFVCGNIVLVAAITYDCNNGRAIVIHKIQG